MSRLSILGAFARIKADEVRERFKKDQQRVDENLPLGIEIGSYIKFPIMPFLDVKDLSDIERPDGRLKVVAYGKIVDDGDVIHRFYLSDERSLLQIVTEEDGTIYDGEIKFLQQAEALTPGPGSNAGDWDVWLDDLEEHPDTTFLIGYETFQRPGSEKVYSRMTQYDGSEQIAPNINTEIVYSDSYGEKKLRFRHQWMDYGTYLGLGDGAEPDENTPEEWLFLDAISRGEEEAWVDIAVGITLRESDLSVA